MCRLAIRTVVVRVVGNTQGHQYFILGETPPGYEVYIVSRTCKEMQDYSSNYDTGYNHSAQAGGAGGGGGGRRDKHGDKKDKDSGYQPEQDNPSDFVDLERTTKPYKRSNYAASNHRTGRATHARTHGAFCVALLISFHVIQR